MSARKRNPPDASAKSGTLVLIATPIGNLGDISRRAIENLTSADTILCEDKRHSGRLLAHLGIKSKLMNYHDHSSDADRANIIQKLEAGEVIALISDAGTPTIADPGFKLVRDAHAHNIHVTAIPGANAAITALSISGLPSNRFLFEGFLPSRSAARRKSLEKLKTIPATLIFYETGKRLAAMLVDAHTILGNRNAAIIRELTKLHETILTGTLHDLHQRIENQPAPKGEITVIVEPPSSEPEPISDDDITRLIQTRLNDLPPGQLARELAPQTGLSTKELYERIIEVKKKTKK